MKILNFGSLNIDNVFKVEHIVEPGQTIDSFSVNTYPGGKGLNQTLAISRAGARPYHAGLIGEDGEWLKKILQEDCVDCRFVRTVDKNTGSAFIQVDARGQNSIVLNGGANRENSEAFCREVLSGFGEGDIILLQNEISCVDILIELANEKKMMVVLNPSPINETILNCDLSKISMFIMNEDEGMQITGKTDDAQILEEMEAKFPQAQVVLTLGSRGSCYCYKGEQLYQKAHVVTAVDTTAAGDTFTGYLLATMAEGKPMKECLDLATRASAIAVTKKGAASSIPYMSEVLSTLL